MNQVLTNDELGALLDSKKVEEGRSTKKERETSIWPFKLGKVKEEEARSYPCLEEALTEMSYEIGAVMAQYSGREVSCQFMEIETFKVTEVAERSPNWAMAARLGLEGRKEPGFIAIDKKFFYCIFEARMGGDGSGEPGPEKQLTPIEEKAANEIAEPISAAHSAIWKKLLNVKITSAGVEQSPRWGVGVDEDLEIARARFRLNMANIEGDLSIFLPRALLDGLPHRQKKKKEDPKKIEKPASPKMFENLADVSVTVSADFGSAEITVRKLLELKAGDTLMLASGKDQKIEISAEGRVLFNGQCGVSNHKKAVKIIGLPK